MVYVMVCKSVGLSLCVWCLPFVRFVPLVRGAQILTRSVWGFAWPISRDPGSSPPGFLPGVPLRMARKSARNGPFEKEICEEFSLVQPAKTSF